MDEAESTKSFDFLEWLDWAHANRKMLVTAGVAIAVIAVGVSLYSWHARQTEENARAALSQLPSAWDVIAGEKPTDHPSAEALLKVAQDYPKTAAGEQAAVLAGVAYFDAGKYPDSERQFARFLASYPDSAMAPQALQGVATSLEAQGKITDAIAKYQEVVQKFPTEPLIQPVKLTLGRLYEERNDLTNALRYYDQLAQQSPTANYSDPWRVEAEQRESLIFAKHPELKPKPATPAPTPVQPSLTAPAPSTPSLQPAQPPSLQASPAQTVTLKPASGAAPAGSNPPPSAPK